MDERRVQRKLSAILAADVVGYSRLMEVDEQETITRFKVHRKDLIDPLLNTYRGRIVKTTGDGLLVEFASAVDATECAVSIQQSILQHEANIEENRRIYYRIGINLGDVVIDGDDILGDGVNVAARLEGLAMPGSVFISRHVYDQVAGKLGIDFLDLGDRSVKNISRVIRVWGWSPHGAESLVSWIRKVRPIDKMGELSICVLPFQARSGDPEDNYLAEGIAEDVTTELSGYGWLKVIARSTSFTYRGEALATASIGNELGIRYILRGNVRRHQERLRVVAQLVEAATGRQIWAQHYDSDLGDLFDLQSEIAQSVAGAIQPELITAEMQRVRGASTENMKAWDYAVRGRWHVLRIKREDNAEAKKYLEQALALDPNCVVALAFLAYSHYVDVFFGWSTSVGESLKQANELALRAVALDENDCWVQCALGLGSFIAKDPDTAVAHLRKAIAVNPSFALGHGYLALVLAFSGEAEMAIQAAKRAMSLSPKDPELFHFLVAIGTAHFVAGRYENAAEWGRKVVAEQPMVSSGHRLVATSLGQLGRSDEARMALGRALEITPMMSAASIRKNIHFKNPNDLDRYVFGLEAAGLGQ
jgi:adenylate cyclase